jgi:hypothetical protein
LNSNGKLKEKSVSCTGKHWIRSLQQTAVLGTAHIIWKVLQCGTGSVSGGGQRWVKGSTGKESFVTRDNNNNNNNNGTLEPVYAQ